jgi:hypothetical protein
VTTLHEIKRYEHPRPNASPSYQRVYRLDPPVTVSNDWDECIDLIEYVMISRVDDVCGYGPETYMFQCDENGQVLEWMEMDGSMKGDWSHEDVIKEAGWTLAPLQLESGMEL